MKNKNKQFTDSKKHWLSLVALLALSILPQKSWSISVPSTGPCTPHPGAPYPDETAECLGNISVGISLVNTDLVLVYHSVDSELDQLPNREDRDFLGRGWRFLGDASLFFTDNSSAATLVTADGTTLKYQKDTAGTYWPKDLRITKSYVQYIGGVPIQTLSDGTKIFFEHSQSNIFNLTKVVSPAGKTILQFQRDASGQIIQISGYGFNGGTLSCFSTYCTIAGHTLSFSSDSLLLTSVNFPSPGPRPLVATFSYDGPSQQLTQYKDAWDKTTLVRYGSSRQVYSVTNPDNFVTYFTYSTNAVTIKSLQGTQVQSFEGGKLTSTVHSESGSNVVLTRDSLSRVTRINQDGRETVFDFSASPLPFLPSRVTKPDGVTIAFEYETRSPWKLLSKKTVTGPNRIPFVTSYGYDYATDSIPRLASVTDGGAVTQYVYTNRPNGAGWFLSDFISKVNGVDLFRAHFNEQANQMTTTDSRGLTTTTKLNGTFGLPVSISSREYGQISFNYDEAIPNMPKVLTGPEGTRSFQYGPLGNVTSDYTQLNSGGTRRVDRKLTVN